MFAIYVTIAGFYTIRYATYDYYYYMDTTGVMWFTMGYMTHTSYYIVYIRAVKFI